MRRSIFAAVISLTLSVFQAPPQKFIPDPVQSSDLIVRLDLVGSMTSHENPTSPAVAGSTLLLIDQAVGIYGWTGSTAEQQMLRSPAPPGVLPAD